MSDPITDVLLEGFRLQRLGRRGDAERAYRDVLARDRGNVHALNLLGIVCLESGRADEAEDLIRRALVQVPHDAESLANHGLALKDLRRFAEAADELRRSLHFNGDNPVTHNNLGNVLAALGQDNEAVKSFRRALALNPDYADCLSNLASALNRQGRLRAAGEAAARAVALDPRSADALNVLGEIQLKQARHQEASATFRRALELRPAFDDAALNLSAATKDLGNIADAEKLIRDVLIRDPANAQAHTSLGVLLEQTGDAAGAARAFRAAIAAQPLATNAYYQLAQLKDETLSLPEQEKLRALGTSASLTDEQRAPLEFALACVAERSQDYDSAFAHFAAAQAIKGRDHPYDDKGVEEFHRRICSTFETRHPEPPVAPAVENSCPIFVLGMPRSGTSLAEQILATHPQVVGAGELGLMDDTVAEVERIAGIPFPEGVKRLSPIQLAELGAYYRTRLERFAPGRAWIVDKTPFNFQYVGLIAAILPDARIVHCRRDAIDNCVSIFKLPFEDSHSYSHGLASLGLFYRRYAALMEHWKLILPGRIHELRYETLVDDTEREVQKLLDAIGLPFDTAVLRFHETERVVKTPSASQVRRPIYRGSISAWRRYERHLRPLIEALGSTASDDGGRTVP